MPIPRYEISINEHRSVYFQHANTLLESLEAQDVNVHYQCREGYCGSCRVQLLEGEVYYYEEPLAWVNNNEILTCCCIPKSDLKIKLRSEEHTSELQSRPHLVCRLLLEKKKKKTRKKK